MSRFAWLLLALLTPACSEPTPTDRMNARMDARGSWSVTVVDEEGRPQAVGDVAFGVEFDASGASHFSAFWGEFDPFSETLEVPATQGWIELWVPGCRPIRVEDQPDAPVRLVPGPPLDVVLHPALPLDEGESVIVRARWRGPGDRPDALIRDRFPAAAREPGGRSWTWTGALDGVRLDAAAPSAQIHVPWAGPYRITWTIGRVEIEERPGYFSFTGRETRSPGAGLAVTVPEDGTVPAVTIGPNRS